MQEFYEELGLTQDATDEEITARYNQLKEKYSEERWQDGEAGNRAAKKLTKIQTAYQEIMSARKETKAEGEKITSLEEVAKLLKEGDVLVLAGKGTENYQEIMGVKTKYSDKETVKDIIAKIGFSGELI